MFVVFLFETKSCSGVYQWAVVRFNNLTGLGRVGRLCSCIFCSLSLTANVKAITLNSVYVWRQCYIPHQRRRGCWLTAYIILPVIIVTAVRRPPSLVVIDSCQEALAYRQSVLEQLYSPAGCRTFPPGQFSLSRIAYAIPKTFPGLSFTFVSSCVA